MKTVLFIPGFQEDLNDRDYASMITAIKKRGYKVEFITLNWLRTTIEQWVPEFEAIYAKYDPAQTILAGFSFGAVTAFMAAVHRNPAELWLFSLSPYFTEDLASREMKPAWLKEIGHRRVTAFDELSFKTLTPTISSKMLFFYGTEELKRWPNIDYRTKLVRTLKNAKIIMAEGAGHDVGDPHYIDAIIKAI